MRADVEKFQACPRCAADMPVDDRFVVWCAACEWNVDPEPPQPEGDRLERARRALARRHGEKLLAELTSGSPRTGRDAASVFAHGIALAVHGVTVALAVAGVWWLVRGWGGMGMVPALLLLALAWSLRPRGPRLPDTGPVLLRSDAPELFALVDEIARSVGTHGVDRIVVDTRLNASVLSHGLRGRRQLTLGLPLWEILSPQQRIALLGHELAHYSNGDARRGLVVARAYDSLTAWHYYFAPIPDPTLLEMLVNLVFTVPRLLVLGLLTLLDHLTFRAAQRAEYLADRGAASAGSTAAAEELLDLLLVVESADVVLRSEANRAALAGGRGRRAAEEAAELVWERLHTHMASIPAHESERLRRVGALRGHSVDSTHPPTHLRRTCLTAAAPVPATVLTDTDRARAIAAELAPARTVLARRIARDGLDG